MKPSAPVTRTVRPPKTSPNSRRRAASESSVQGEPFPVTFIVGGCPTGATESMPGTRKSAVRRGVVTGLSSLAVAGSAAGAGILLAHFFGRNERTDGLFVAYGVYLVLAIAAQAFRTVVLPQLTREAVSLGSETRAYLLALAGAGVFALAGGKVVGPILGGAYGGEVGRELGRLVAYLAPWMVVSVAYTLTFPLLFVLERSRGLVAIAVGGLALSVPIVLAGRELAGLAGIAGALAVSTGLVLAALLVAVSGAALRRTAAELGRLALQVAALAAVTFGLASLLGGVAGAGGGFGAYPALLAALRPRGLREAWSYVRALH